MLIQIFQKYKITRNNKESSLLVFSVWASEYLFVAAEKESERIQVERTNNNILSHNSHDFGMVIKGNLLMRENRTILKEKFI